MSEMSCSICVRPAGNRIHLYCPTCARSQLYMLRYETARVQLEKESIGNEVEAVVVGDSNGRRVRQSEAEKPDSTSSSRAAHNHEARGPKWDVQVAQTEQARSLDRIRTIRDHANTLRVQIEQGKIRARQLREQSRQRRSDAESANYQLRERRNASLLNIQNGIKRAEHLWHSLHSKTAESRIFLCREAAYLYGLRQEVERQGDGRKRERYIIGGVQIVDLRHLNGASPSHVSTALATISRLLVIVSHYLSLRLPAQIVLPHRNHATPTIFTPAASYSSSRDSMSENQQTHSQLKPRDARKHRARPLHVDKTLPKLAKEEPATYALFVEGVSLLAWNVSWLCRTQGLNIGSDSWDDICDIGKNLWQLLVSPTTAHDANKFSSTRVISTRDTLTVQQSKPGNQHQQHQQQPPKTSIQRHKSFPMLGHYSHGTSHSFLAAAEGVEFMKTWKLPTPAKIADKLKSVLLGEMANAEWELLEEKEWDDRGDVSTGPSTGSQPQPPAAAAASAAAQSSQDVVGNGHKPVSRMEVRGAATVAVAPADTAASTGTAPASVVTEASSSNGVNNNTTKSGTSGWTKLKSKRDT